MLIKPIAFCLLVYGYWILSAHTAPAQTPIQIPCQMQATMTDRLARQFKEQPIGVGLINRSAALVLYTSPSGSWTLVSVTPRGMSCVKAAGSAWSPIKKKKQKETKRP